MNKKKLTALIITALCITSAAKVSAAPSVKRIYGQTRYETAASISKEGWKEKSNYAVIVNGENFPDAITAAPLASKYKAPILLTPKNELSPFTSVELKRLGVKNVFIIGGKGVIYQNVEDGIKSMGIKVTRLGGKTRYETALLVAGKVGKSKQIAVVDGTSFGDAVSIAPIAALKQMPIILAQKNYIPDDVMKYLDKQKKAEQIYVIGGKDFINDNLIKKIPNSKRIAEGGMYDKNVQIINAFKNELNLNNLYIASGKDYADALAGSALAAQNAVPILLVDNTMPEPSKRFLQSQVINEIGVLGGPAVVNSSVIQSSKDLPLEVADVNNIVKNIYQNEEFTPPKTMIITASDNSKKEMPVDWNLKKIDTTKPGIYTFKGSIEDYNKDIILTLIVKPIPDKIDDIKAEAETRSSYNLPDTVTATMSDGSLGDVDVSWDYGTQKKPGIYEFLGTVDRYSKKIKLTLTIKQQYGQNIKSINNLKYIVDKKSDFTLPRAVTATMQDNSKKGVAISWGTEKKYKYYDGVYIYEGIVKGYNKKVSLMLIVRDENGIDPNDPIYPTKPDDPNNPTNPDNPENPGESIKNIGELEPIVQGDPYPTTVIDPDTKKPAQVTWTRSINIDTTFVDADNIDDCRVAKVTLEGTIGGNKKVKATIGIIPKILGITTEYNGTNIVPAVIPIESSGVYDMSNATQKLRAVIIGPDGHTRTTKKVNVLLWDPPYIDIGDSQNYYVRATINHFSNPIMVTLQVRR
ncbi:N-acetylmuramoyl-L-alanine amidase LytC precursor [Clostridium acetireducens DSM 10703]|uniref:N-acetylmuramoyl-L-alanine amidase LytC n=1 Tax=Clostridium acetireducens DSM 10703 TaxID=1121290 RepID=A0A1E8EY53_9CLOT|nr:cell wall-binding repeat-containing protein [Clostridium acetireducens]OFI05866.1 N-acetylmuramoyl-L-alanine amidase LytC precursor [Clostridium acetireducens DSM 10703]